MEQINQVDSHEEGDSDSKKISTSSKSPSHKDSRLGKKGSIGENNLDLKKNICFNGGRFNISAENNINNFPIAANKQFQNIEERMVYSKQISTVISQNVIAQQARKKMIQLSK